MNFIDSGQSDGDDAQPQYSTLKTPLENQQAARMQLQAASRDQAPRHATFETQVLRRLENIHACIAQVMEKQDRLEVQRQLLERNSVLDERAELMRRFNLPVDGIVEAQQDSFGSWSAKATRSFTERAVQQGDKGNNLPTNAHHFHQSRWLTIYLHR